MKYVDVDLHKKTISLCVMVKADGQRQVACRKRFACTQPELIRKFFEDLGQFQVVVEATSSYEWFLLLIEEFAERCVLAHRVFVRHRRWLDGRITAVKCKLRHKLAHYNADIAGLFTERGAEYLAGLTMSTADRFEGRQLQEELDLYLTQLRRTDKQLREFAKRVPLVEREARAVLDTIPQVGPVTIDAVLSELGDWRRFRSAKKAVAYAGLNPGRRESDRKVKQLSITKEGSRIPRWALIQAAWRLANTSPPLATHLRNAATQHGFREESHRRRGQAAAVRDVRPAARRKTLRLRRSPALSLPRASPTKAISRGTLL